MLLDSGMVAVDTMCCCGGGACCLPPCCPDVAMSPYSDGMGNCYKSFSECEGGALSDPVPCGTLWLGIHTEACCDNPALGCNNCEACSGLPTFSDEYYDPTTCEFVNTPGCFVSACSVRHTLIYQCSDTGECAALSADDCTTAGGFFHSGVTCDPNPCLGACCIAGVCSLLTEATCALFGGTYQGGGTICIPNPC